MFPIEQIKELLSNEKFVMSKHAFLRAIERKIQIEEICEIGSNAIIIEEYPDDKYSPSCLVLGYTKNFCPLHIQITIDSSKLLKIITIYEPEENLWLSDMKRRK